MADPKMQLINRRGIRSCPVLFFHISAHPRNPRSNTYLPRMARITRIMGKGRYSLKRVSMRPKGVTYRSAIKRPPGFWT